MARKVTGKGQWWRARCSPPRVTFGNALLIEQAVIAPNRVPTGNRGQTAAPVDIFRTTRWLDPGPGDRRAAVQALGQADGRGGLARPIRASRTTSRAATTARSSASACSRWCAERTTAEALEILAKAMIPSGPVLKPQQTLDDPHIQAMGFFQPIEFPGAPKPAPIAKAPVWLSGTPGSIRRRAPTLGEHTDQISPARLRQEGDRGTAAEGRGLRLRGAAMNCRLHLPARESRMRRCRGGSGARGSR